MLVYDRSKVRRLFSQSHDLTFVTVSILTPLPRLPILPIPLRNQLSARQLDQQEGKHAARHGYRTGKCTHLRDLNPWLQLLGYLLPVREDSREVEILGEGKKCSTIPLIIIIILELCPPLVIFFLSIRSYMYLESMYCQTKDF